MGGLRQDKDGWDQGVATTTGDFFMTKAVAATRSTQESPAKELFEWCIAYRMTNFQPGQPWEYLCNNRDTSDQMTGIQVEQESSRSSKMLGLRYKWVQAGAIQVDVRYSFHTCSKLMKIEAKITNLHPDSHPLGQMEAPAFMVMVNGTKTVTPLGPQQARAPSIQWTRSKARALWVTSTAPSAARARTISTQRDSHSACRP